MEELELGESNEWLSFIHKESSHFIHFTSLLGAMKYPRVCTHTSSSFLYRTAYSIFLHGRHSHRGHQCLLHWRGRVNLSDGISKCVLLPPRMRNGGSGWVFMFVLALAFSMYPALGILKQTCPVPSSVHCSIVFHFPHWWKWKRNRHKHPIVNYEICTGNCEVFTKQTWLCHGKETLSREGVTGAFPASEVCPALSLRCWDYRALGFFHYTRVMLLVWFTQYVLAAFAGFCGSKSAAQAEAQTLPGLHSKYNMHGEETSINNLFSPVKDDIVLRSLVLFHFVNLMVPTGCRTMSYSKHRHRK